jgi:hypothetical protein
MGSVQVTTIIGRRAFEHHAKSGGIIAGWIGGYASSKLSGPPKSSLARLTRALGEIERDRDGGWDVADRMPAIHVLARCDADLRTPEVCPIVWLGRSRSQFASLVNETRFSTIEF